MLICATVFKVKDPYYTTQLLIAVTHGLQAITLCKETINLGFSAITNIRTLSY